MAGPEAVFAVGDIGATNSRARLMTIEGHPVGDMPPVPTITSDYEGSVGSVVDRLDQVATERGLTIVGGSFAIAGTPDSEGKLIQAGGLSPWIGRYPGRDLADGLGLGEESIGVMNDVVAIAASQQAVNKENGRPVDGTAATWSSGFNVANYLADGGLQGDEAGHEVLELDGEHAVCPCDEHNLVDHVEGFVSGDGIHLNTGIAPVEWLRDPKNASKLVTRMSTALIQMIERHSRERGGFSAQEMAWTGSVALKNPFLVRRVAGSVKKELGPDQAPAFVTADMGEDAGLHGTFVDAKRRAQVA